MGQDLTTADAKQAVEDNIVEIIDDQHRHIANGLLITRNGFFVTSYHCVDSDSNAHAIRLRDKKVYPIAKICGYNSVNDIALVKAEVDGPKEVITYKFSESPNLPRLTPVAIISLWNNKLVKKFGTTKSFRPIDVKTIDNKKAANQMILNLIAYPGDSGSAIVTVDGDVYGIVCGIDNTTKEFVTTCTYWHEALNIIALVANAKSR